jgi:hypothetical protein
MKLAFAVSDFLGLGAVYLVALGLAFGQVWAVAAGAGLAAGCLAWCLWRARK